MYLIIFGASHYVNFVYILCFQVLRDPLSFAYYSLNVILIENKSLK